MKGFLFILCLIPMISFAGSKVIYGEDNRVDVYMADPLYQQLALSTAAMLSNNNLTLQDDSYVISAPSMMQKGICKSEPFAEQITAARCSGFLVGEDLLVTAGHCIRSEYDCNNYVWVFDYSYEPGSPYNYVVGKDSVYKCKKIVEQNLDYYTQEDYALIQLEKVVVDRKPLSFRNNGKIEDRTHLVVIGHPTGLPTKVAGGAYVRKNESNAYFVANLDTYGGNSGSAVFDAYSGVVEGILVRGENDFVYDQQKRCSVSNKCSDEGCRGEDVSRITTIKKLMEL